MEWIRDWWPVAVAALSAVVGFRSGQERNRWRIDAAEERLTKAEREIDAIQKERTLDAVTLGIIQTTLEQIKGMIGDMRAELKSKADK